MLSIILNSVGIILILYAIYVIKKDLTKKTMDEHDLDSVEKKVKEYYNRTEDIIKDFDDLIEAKLDMINIEEDLNDRQDIESIINKGQIFDNGVEVNEDIEPIINPIHKKITDLKTIGLTNEEIAKKLNRGIREIEMVLKMHQNNE